MARRDMVRREAQAPIYIDENGRDVSRGGSVGRDWRGIANMFALLIVAIIASIVFVHLYWGPDGVQIYGYILLVAGIVFLVWTMIMQNFNMFSRHTRDIVRSTTEALIDVQVSDDKGEVARIISALQSSNHDSAMLASRMVTTSKQMADDMKANGSTGVPSIQELLATQFGSGADRKRITDNEDDEDDDDIV
jgi:hypothetical protein